jgi:hypothetical protein
VGDEADDEKVQARRGGILATSGVEENAERLLGAFYDLSGEKLTEPVSLGGPEMPGQGAAPRADLDPESTECEVAARYLVNQGYIAPADAASRYVITVAGFDRVRAKRCSYVQTRGVVPCVHKKRIILSGKDYAPLYAWLHRTGSVPWSPTLACSVLARRVESL